MKNVIKTQSRLANSIMVAGFMAFGCAAIGGKALGAEAPSANAAVYPVRYSDLDTSNIQGARTLYLRIRHAAEVLCESAATWGKKEGQACVNKAVDDAVVRVDRPLVSQYRQLRTKSDKAGLVQLAKTN
jgi:UrcA family protein